MYQEFNEIITLNATVKKEIINEVGRLGYEQQRRLLDFARVLVITGPAGVQGGTGFEPGGYGNQGERRHAPSTPEVAPEVTPEVKKLLSLLKGEMSRKEIQQKLGLKDEKHFREAYQQAAVAAGLIEMTVPDKPKSRLQKYRITPKGIGFVKEGK